MRERLQPGSIIVFDEYFNYANWERHEFKAWQEFVTKYGVNHEYLVSQVFLGLTIGLAWRFQPVAIGQAPIAPERISFEAMGPEMGIVPSDDRALARSMYLFEGRNDAPPQRTVMIKAWFQETYPYVVPIAYVLMMIGVVGYLFVPGATHWAILSIFALHSANVLALCILVDPQFRYQMQSVPLAILGAGFGIFRITSWLSAGYNLARQRSGRHNASPAHAASPRKSGTASRSTL